MFEVCKSTLSVTEDLVSHKAVRTAHNQGRKMAQQSLKVLRFVVISTVSPDKVWEYNKTD